MPGLPFSTRSVALDSNATTSPSWLMNALLVAAALPVSAGLAAFALTTAVSLVRLSQRKRSRSVSAVCSPWSALTSAAVEANSR
jgi:hypothetical protein